VAFALVLAGGGVALAEPAWDGNCLQCHGDLQPGLISVYGEDTMADPDESQTGAPDRGELKVFQVRAAESKDLHSAVMGLLEGDAYAVALTRLRFNGVENGGELAHMGDCAWPEWDEPGNYYSHPVIAHTWGPGPELFSFDITVEAGTGYDYYNLTFTLAGRFETDGSLFTAKEHFYLQVLPIRGDLDEDGDVDLDDFATFAGCLNGPEVMTPPAGCTQTNFTKSDLDEDSDVDLDDFAVFGSRFTVPSP
jgi:hypothetical protein